MTDSESEHEEVNDIQGLFWYLNKKLKSLGRIEKRMDQMDERIERIDEEIFSINTKFDAVNERQEKLETRQNNLITVTGGLINHLNQLQNSVHELQQHQLANKIIIRGIPEIEETRQDSIQIVQSIFDAISIDVSALTAVRIGKIDENEETPAARPIEVELRDEESKKLLIRKKREEKNRNLTCADITYKEEALGSAEEVIYIDEKITQNLSKLYASTRKLKREGVIKATWVRNGSLFVRETEKGPFKKILSDDDLKCYNKNVQTADETVETSKDETLKDLFDKLDERKKEQSKAGKAITRSNKNATSSSTAKPPAKAPVKPTRKQSTK